VPLIMGEIRRHLRDDGPMRVSRSLKQLAVQARRVREQLANELQRDPTVHEVAAELGVPPEEVVAALDGVRTRFNPPDGARGGRRPHLPAGPVGRGG